MGSSNAKCWVIFLTSAAASVVLLAATAFVIAAHVNRWLAVVLVTILALRCAPDCETSLVAIFACLLFPLVGAFAGTPRGNFAEMVSGGIAGLFVCFHPWFGAFIKWVYPPCGKDLNNGS
jgi:hypothetical protein